MEFKEYGPLDQSKSLSKNRNTILLPLILLAGICVIFGYSLKTTYDIKKPPEKQKT